MPNYLLVYWHQCTPTLKFINSGTTQKFQPTYSKIYHNYLLIQFSKDILYHPFPLLALLLLLRTENNPFTELRHFYENLWVSSGSSTNVHTMAGTRFVSLTCRCNFLLSKQTLISTFLVTFFQRPESISGEKSEKTPYRSFLLIKFHFRHRYAILNLRHSRYC